MERLPHIDTHERRIAAPPAAVWAALLRVLGGTSGRGVPAPLATAWGIDPRGRAGDWRGGRVVAGDALPGFTVAGADPARRLALTGRHRFSTYALTFTLRAGDDGVTVLAARSDGVFPGVAGRVYRALVIGSRGHVVVVRGLLARVARAAEGQTTPPGDAAG